jgi:hypothetical protein
MHLIDLPKYYPETAYLKLIDKIVSSYKHYDEILMIYQIGSISTPGISDLDLVFVFKDDLEFKINIKEKLIKKENYLLYHNSFGIPDKYVNDIYVINMFSNFRLLYKKENDENHIVKNNRINEAIKIQTALEYLLKFFISLSIQNELRAYKVRSLLLEIKALRYDFEILGNTSNELMKCYNNLLDLRENWFNINKCKRYFVIEILTLFPLLFNYLKIMLNKNIFKLPIENDFNCAKNYKLILKNDFNYKSSGIGRYLLNLGFNSKKLFNLASRFNKYILELIWINQFEENDIILKKFEIEKILISYNRKYLPYFLPLKSSLNI